MWHKCGTVLFAGLLSGSLLGVFEAIQLLLAVGAGEYDALFWGGVGYAITGAVTSLPLIILFWRISYHKKFAWTIPIVMGTLGFAFLNWNFWVLLPLSLVPWITGIILEKTPLRILQTPKGAFGWSILWFGLLTIFSLTLSRTIYSPPVHQNSSYGRPSVMMVVIDGLKVSDLYKGHTPALDAFGKESIEFEQGFTDGGTGFSTLASALVGEPVSNSSPLFESYTTLAERLAFEGYHTVALVSDESVGRFSNLHQGFDRFRYLPPKFNNRFLRIGLHNEGTFHLELFKVLNQFWISKPREVSEILHHFSQELLLLNTIDEPWFAMLHLSPPRTLGTIELQNLDRHLGQMFLSVGSGKGAPIVILTATPESRMAKSHVPMDPHVPLFMRLSPPVRKTVKNPVQLSEVPFTLSTVLGIVPDSEWRSSNIIRLPPMEKNRPIRFHHHTPQLEVDLIQVGGWRWVRQSGTEYLYDVSSDPSLEHNVIQQFPDKKDDLIQYTE